MRGLAACGPCGLGLARWLAEGADGSNRHDAGETCLKGGAGDQDPMSRVSTAASLSDLGCGGSPEHLPGLLDCLVAVDPVQLLGFCAMTDLVRFRKCGRSMTLEDGVLSTASVLRLAKAFLHVRPAGASLHDAAEDGDGEAALAHVLLGAGLDAYDAHGCVPLHYAADRRHTPVLRLLVRAGADVHARHEGRNIRAGWTPLHFAAYAGGREVLLFLLLGGAEVNRMDNCRRTALYYAENRNREACARLLEKFGGKAVSHLVEAANLREAQRVDQDNVLDARDQAVHQWDASVDAAETIAEAASARLYTDRDADSALTAPAPTARLRPYVGPAGDSGPSLTLAALEMPGFEW